MVSVETEAVDHLKTIIEEGQCLRLQVQGGGCNGFQYNLSLDTADDSDLQFESEGIIVAVDKDSHDFVDGSTIRYTTKGLQTGFMVDNPETIPCGCGHSFTKKDGPGAC